MNPDILKQMVKLGKLSPEQAQTMMHQAMGTSPMQPQGPKPLTPDPSILTKMVQLGKTTQGEADVMRQRQAAEAAPPPSPWTPARVKAATTPSDPGPMGSPTLDKMALSGQSISPEMYKGMSAARERAMSRPGAMESAATPMPAAPAPAAPDPFKAAGSFQAGPMAQQPGFQRQSAPGTMSPDQKAMIDAMTGARVHKGMDGRQLGMEGVNPTLKYMLYAMKGRRHKDMSGKDIY